MQQRFGKSTDSRFPLALAEAVPDQEVYRHREFASDSYGGGRPMGQARRPWIAT